MLKVANSVISASRITGVLPVANGGTNASTASITSFNNITGFTASGTTGTTSTNLVFATTPTLVGDVTLSTGNLVIGTAGKGIDFSVTASGSGTMTSELLADYEEGTWTPGVGNQTVVGDYASSGTYTKIGRQVTVRGTATSTGTIAGAAGTYFDNLPFTCASAIDFPGGIGTNDGGSFVRFFGLSASSTSLFIVNGYAAVTGVYFSCTYFV
jgi:hypothetical protein